MSNGTMRETNKKYVSLAAITILLLLGSALVAPSFNAYAQEDNKTKGNYNGSDNDGNKNDRKQIKDEDHGDHDDHGKGKCKIGKYDKHCQDSTTTLTSSINPSDFGQNVVFVATVSPSGATGSVTFSVDGITKGQGTIVGGTAVFSTSKLSPGTHTIVAQYTGSNKFFPSTSSPLTQTVNKGDTKTTVTSSNNPSKFGQKVTFTAKVSPSGATGTVTFSIDGTPQPPVTLSGGQAKISTSTLSVGHHTVMAQYSGDSKFNPSTSGTGVQTVNPKGH